jgi:hypothetical protein
MDREALTTADVALRALYPEGQARALYPEGQANDCACDICPDELAQADARWEALKARILKARSGASRLA